MRVFPQSGQFRPEALFQLGEFLRRGFMQGYFARYRRRRGLQL
ncbi:MAG: hypothetical protein R3F46_07310 [bacterium]